MHMKRRTGAFLLGLNLVLTAGIILFLLVTTLAPKHAEGESSPSYTLCIGLNDQDTNTQLISTDDARELVNEICLKYVDGFTGSPAWGAWTDENGEMVNEQTLVYTFHGTTRENVVAIMDEVLTALNQSSILMLTDSCDPLFYSGQ